MECSLGPDPLFVRIPVRGYKTTQAVQCNTARETKALPAAFPGTPKPARQGCIEARHATFRARMTSKDEDGSSGLANKPWIAKCISDVPGDGVVFAERGGPRPLYNVTGPNQWFGNT
ncbi:MAG: hypothetical protein OXF88_07775 [Rhodobacteraceae bacterium]|nr:hypothetical protein [Paracoccaceae bacterium]MCY4138401.1 hypothetical protein [Paracoccaceae bacterium]